MMRWGGDPLMGKGARRGLGSPIPLSASQPELVILAPKTVQEPRLGCLFLSPAPSQPLLLTTPLDICLQIPLIRVTITGSVYPGLSPICLPGVSEFLPGAQYSVSQESILRMFLGPHFMASHCLLISQLRLRSILIYNRKNKQNCRCFPRLLKTLFLLSGPALVSESQRHLCLTTESLHFSSWHTLF